ncbi:unnamed protein product, partial [Mesorhabditis belari]|uniref:C2H2-type domain-containing protein n=1 Tax=Mesorhabditis belari TaxID=2138241 RepID=A0AAF3FSS4_9BILA
MKHDTTRSKFGPSKCQFNGCTVSLSNPTPFALICHIGIHSTNKRYTCTGCTYGWAQFHQAYTHTKRCERAANVKDNIDETMLLDWIELGRVCFPDRVDEIQKSGQKQLIKARENENHDPLLSVSDYSFNVKEEMDSDEGNQSLSSPLSATLAAIARIVELPNHCKSEESCSSKSTAETSAVKRKFLKTKDTETASTADVKRFKLHTPSIFTGSWEESPKHECSSCQQRFECFF